MSAPRVLHVSTWKTACGIATYCENFVNSLANLGFENEVFALHPSEWRDMLPLDIQRWEEEILSKAATVDLVHFQHEHGLYGYALGQKFACKRFGSILKGLQKLNIPSVTTFHTDLVTKQTSGLMGTINHFRKKRLWGKYVSKYFGGNVGQCKAIVHSRRTRKSFARNGFDATSLTVIPHPCLPPREITLDPTAAKAELGLSPDNKLLSIFGFIGRYKGPEIALEALKKLPENYCLALVGGMHPESKDAFLNSLVDSMPEELKERVRITGWVDRATADLYFAATDVCLAPYRDDVELSGSGAITWALSSGRPVIASKIDAFQTVNRIGECMLMFTPHCSSELAWAVEKITNDASLRTRLVERANQFCVEHSWESTVANVLQIYESQGVISAGESKLKLVRDAA